MEPIVPGEILLDLGDSSTRGSASAAAVCGSDAAGASGAGPGGSMPPIRGAFAFMVSCYFNWFKSRAFSFSASAPAVFSGSAFREGTELVETGEVVCGLSWPAASPSFSELV